MLFDFIKFKKYDDFEMLKEEIILICKNSENGTSINIICESIQKNHPYKFTRIEVEDTINSLVNYNKILKDKDWSNLKPLSVIE